MVKRRGVTSIWLASGITTFSVMWPTHSSSIIITGTRNSSDRLKPVIVRSKHSWGELGRLPVWVAYAFISPVFDSLSKPGYRANSRLLEMPEGPFPCRPVGLGGVSADTIGMLVARGWRGAAVLGWIWKEPRQAVRRYEQLKKIVDG